MNEEGAPRDWSERIYLAVIALFFAIGALLWCYSLSVELKEIKGTAPAMQPATEAPSSAYVGEFAAERIAGRVRQACEWKERTERTASLHCIYVKLDAKK